ACSIADMVVHCCFTAQLPPAGLTIKYQVVLLELKVGFLNDLIIFSTRNYKSMAILKLDNVLKTYGDFVAVRNVSFEVPQGSIFGLLGPNGAGKTSLIRIITTITQADAGHVYFNNEKLNSRHP